MLCLLPSLGNLRIHQTENCLFTEETTKADTEAHQNATVSLSSNIRYNLRAIYESLFSCNQLVELTASALSTKLGIVNCCVIVDLLLWPCVR